MKQWFSRHWPWDNEGQWSLRDGKHSKWPQWLSQLSAWGQFPGCSAGGGTQAECNDLWVEQVELGVEEMKLREAKAAGVRRTMNQRGESFSERKNPPNVQKSSLKYSPESLPAHVCEDTIVDHVKNHPWGAHTGPRIVPMPTSHIGKPYNSWGIG